MGYGVCDQRVFCGMMGLCIHRAAGRLMDISIGRRDGQDYDHTARGRAFVSGRGAGGFRFQVHTLWEMLGTFELFLVAMVLCFLLI